MTKIYISQFNGEKNEKTKMNEIVANDDFIHSSHGDNGFIQISSVSLPHIMLKRQISLSLSFTLIVFLQAPGCMPFFVKQASCTVTTTNFRAVYKVFNKHHMKKENKLMQSRWNWMGCWAKLQITIADVRDHRTQ